MAAIRRKYQSGSLTTLANTRGSLSVGESKAPAQVRKVALINQVIYVLNEQRAPQGLINAVFGYYVSKFCQEAGHHNIRQENLLASMAGILANCADFGALRPWPSMIDAFSTAGIQLTILEHTAAELSQIFNTDARLQEYLASWGTDVAYMLHDTKTMFILACVTLVAMIKNLTPDNFDGWMANRIRSFSGTLGDTYAEANLSPTHYPLLSNYQSLAKGISANYLLRKELFLSICSLMHDPTSYISRGLKEVFNLYRGHEMNHLVLIDRFILLENPEFLRVPFARGILPRFLRAVKVLSTLNNSDVLYARFLLSKDDANSLNRNHFETEIIIATQLARYKSSTFENYYQSRNEAHDTIRHIVDLYMRNRLNVIPLGLGETRESNLHPREGKYYFEKIEEHLNKEEKEEEQDELDLNLPTQGVSMLA